MRRTTSSIGGAEDCQVGGQEIKRGIGFIAPGDASLIVNADQNQPSAYKKCQRGEKAMSRTSPTFHGKTDRVSANCGIEVPHGLFLAR